MIKVKDVLEFLDTKFPFETACDFDNVGLLVGNGETAVKGVLCCLDATMSAVSKAKETGANLIVTHHPVIFDGLKTVLSDSVVCELCKNDISVISAHTNFDIGTDGVNDILCKVLNLKNVSKVKLQDFVLNSAETDISNPQELAEDIRKKLGFSVRFVAGRPIKNVLVCSGSGSEFIEDAVRLGFDALITADVPHHRFVYAKNSGISLFDAGHFATENICAEPLKNMLKSRFCECPIEAFCEEYINFI